MLDYRYMCGNVLSCLKRKKSPEEDERSSDGKTKHTGTRTLRRLDDSRLYSNSELQSIASEDGDLSAIDMSKLSVNSKESKLVDEIKELGSRIYHGTDDIEASVSQPNYVYPRLSVSTEDYSTMPRTSKIIQMERSDSNFSEEQTQTEDNADSDSTPGRVRFQDLDSTVPPENSSEKISSPPEDITVSAIPTPVELRSILKQPSNPDETETIYDSFNRKQLEPLEVSETQKDDKKKSEDLPEDKV